MSRIYQKECESGVTIGLYQRTNSAELPYVIKRNGQIIYEVENLGDANREYHHQIREEECPF